MHALHVDGIEGHLEESSISKEERRIEAHNNDTGGEQGLGVHLMEQSTMRLVCWGSRNGPPPSCPMRLSQCTSDWWTINDISRRRKEHLDKYADSNAYRLSSTKDMSIIYLSICISPHACIKLECHKPRHHPIPASQAYVLGLQRGASKSKT